MSQAPQGRTTRSSKQRELPNAPNLLPSPPVQSSGLPQRSSNNTSLLDRNVTQRSRARSKGRPNTLPVHVEEDNHDSEDDTDNDVKAKKDDSDDDYEDDSDDTADESSSEGPEDSESEDELPPTQEPLPSRRARKPRQSLGEVVAEADTCRGAVKALKEMNDLIDKTPLDKFEHGYKLGRIKRYSTELLKDIEKVTSRQQKNPKVDVDSLSFSRLREKHLPRLGIAMLPTSNKGIKELRRELELVQLLTHAKVYWDLHNKDTNMGIITLFKKKWRNFSKKPEAKSRLLADDLIFHATECLRQMAYITLSFLEFTISTSKNPIAVNWGNFVTYLTGSVDYTLVCSGQITHVNEDQLEVIQTRADKLGHLSSLEGLLGDKNYHEMAYNYGVGFSIFELKKKLELEKKFTETSLGASLKKHQPQVLGESVAMMTQIKAESLPWCLTNGLDWVFGVVDEVASPESTSGDVRYHSLCLEMISLVPTCIDDKQLFNIFMALVLWVAQDPQKIVDFLSSK